MEIVLTFKEIDSYNKMVDQLRIINFKHSKNVVFDYKEAEIIQNLKLEKNSKNDPNLPLGAKNTSGMVINDDTRHLFESENSSQQSSNIQDIKMEAIKILNKEFYKPENLAQDLAQEVDKTKQNGENEDQKRTRRTRRTRRKGLDELKMNSEEKKMALRKKNAGFGTQTNLFEKFDECINPIMSISNNKQKDELEKQFYSQSECISDQFDTNKILENRLNPVNNKWKDVFNFFGQDNVEKLFQSNVSKMSLYDNLVLENIGSDDENEDVALKEINQLQKKAVSTVIEESKTNSEDTSLTRQTKNLSQSDLSQNSQMSSLMAPKFGKVAKKKKSKSKSRQKKSKGSKKLKKKKKSVSKKSKNGSKKLEIAGIDDLSPDLTQKISPKPKKIRQHRFKLDEERFKKIIKPNLSNLYKEASKLDLDDKLEKLRRKVMKIKLDESKKSRKYKMLEFMYRNHINHLEKVKKFKKENQKLEQELKLQEELNKQMDECYEPFEKEWQLTKIPGDGHIFMNPVAYSQLNRSLNILKYSYLHLIPALKISSSSQNILNIYDYLYKITKERIKNTQKNRNEVPDTLIKIITQYSKEVTQIHSRDQFQLGIDLFRKLDSYLHFRSIVISHQLHHYIIILKQLQNIKAQTQKSLEIFTPGHCQEPFIHESELCHLILGKQNGLARKKKNHQWYLDRSKQDVNNILFDL